MSAAWYSTAVHRAVLAGRRRGQDTEERRSGYPAETARSRTSTLQRDQASQRDGRPSIAHFLHFARPDLGKFGWVLKHGVRYLANGRCCMRDKLDEAPALPRKFRLIAMQVFRGHILSTGELQTHGSVITREGNRCLGNNLSVPFSQCILLSSFILYILTICFCPLLKIYNISRKNVSKSFHFCDTRND